MTIYLYGQVQKAAIFFNAGALITREIVRSKDAQCNTEE